MGFGNGSVFIDFIALIILSHIRNIMPEKGLYKTMIKLELIRRMEKLGVLSPLRRQFQRFPADKGPPARGCQQA
jgi:hypothetical protein